MAKKFIKKIERADYEALQESVITVTCDFGTAELIMGKLAILLASVSDTNYQSLQPTKSEE